jgi:hypothetical protein
MPEKNVETLSIETEQEDGLSFTDLFMMFWRRRVLITVMTIIGALAGVLVSVIVNATSIKVSTIVEYQWNGINQGEYPNGTRFDVSSAFGPNVYNGVIEQLNVDVTANEARNALSITPIVPNNVITLIQAAVEKGETFSYFPTTFKYTLDASAISISESDGKQFLDELINEFTLEFQETFVNQIIIRNFAFDNFSSYDLLDQVNVINNQITSMTKLLEDLVKVQPRLATFRSSTSGFTVNDILSQTSLLKTLQLNAAESLIVSNQLAKEPDDVIDRLIFNNRIMGVELAKEQQFLAELNNLVENYSGSTSTLIIPGYEGIINTTSALESIYEEIIETQQNIAELEQDIAYTESLILELENAIRNNLLITRAQNELNVVVENLTLIIDNTNTLLTDYNDVLNRDVTRVLATSTPEPGLSTLLTAGIGLLSSGFLSLLLAFFISNKRKD